MQPHFNVETTLIKIDDQRCLNVDLTIMCLLGNLLSFNYFQATSGKAHSTSPESSPVVSSFSFFFSAFIK